MTAESAKESAAGIGLIIYVLGFIATFFYLTFLDGYPYNWWNWMVAIPVNGFMGAIWPIYWLILAPLFPGSW